MKRRLLPLAVLLGGFAVAALMIATGPEVQPRPSRAVAPLVRVVEVVPKTVQLRAWTHGTVVPRTESDLVPEVGGRVVEISPSLVSGGFSAKGDVLLRIEPVDYEVALEHRFFGERIDGIHAVTVGERARDEQIEDIRALVQLLCNGPLDREAHVQARIEMMRAFLVTSENLVCRLIAKSIFAQFAPSMAVLDQYFQLDVAAFTVFVSQLDQALASRDRDAVLAIFDGITKLHRETMMRAIEAASHDNQYQTGVVAS